MGSPFDRQLQELFKNAGCVFVRHGKGSHAIWHSPITDSDFTVSQNIKSRPTASAILKRAGIDKKPWRVNTCKPNPSSPNP